MSIDPLQNLSLVFFVSQEFRVLKFRVWGLGKEKIQKNVRRVLSLPSFSFSLSLSLSLFGALHASSPCRLLLHLKGANFFDDDDFDDDDERDDDDVGVFFFFAIEAESLCRSTKTKSFDDDDERQKKDDDDSKCDDVWMVLETKWMRDARNRRVERRRRRRRRTKRTVETRTTRTREQHVDERHFER